DDDVVVVDRRGTVREQVDHRNDRHTAAGHLLRPGAAVQHLAVVAEDLRVAVQVDLELDVRPLVGHVRQRAAAAAFIGDQASGEVDLDRPVAGRAGGRVLVQHDEVRLAGEGGRDVLLRLDTPLAAGQVERADHVHATAHVN